MLALDGADAPTGIPQRWQNLAPGERAVRQTPHCAPASAAPQLEQNRPVAVAWQLGQTVDVGAVMPEKNSARTLRSGSFKRESPAALSRGRAPMPIAAGTA